MAEQDEQELSETTVKINGIEHTMMLSKEDAQRYKDAEKSQDATDSGDSDDAKAKTPANKARTSTTSK